MRDYKLKLRYIVLGLLKINILFTSLYLILYWILILKLDLNIDDKIVTLYLPFIISIAGAILFRSAVKLLIFRDNRISGAYYMLAMISILLSCIFGGEKLYIINSKTSHLEKISDFDLQNHATFYTIENFNLAHNYMHHTIKVNFEVTRSSSDYSYNLYFVIPAIDSEASPSETPKVWFTKKYKFYFNDLKNLNTKRNIYNFLEDSKREFASDNFKNYYCFKRLKKSDDRKEALKSINSIIKLKVPDDAIILTPIEKNPYNKDNTLLLLILPYIIISCMIIGAKLNR